VLDAILVVVWIVAVINAFNLIDGLDGLASGLAVISATGLCGILVLGHLSGAILVLVALAGACLAFLRYNFHPATIFLGDTGSMFIGLVLGVVALQSFTKNTFILSLARYGAGQCGAWQMVRNRLGPGNAPGSCRRTWNICIIGCSRAV
jgi:UDP-N-acetylmuramyl pentapeptide phosphotransferase/UDP-N-acetylglucosamine-1-phosphate transferase